MKKFEDVSEKVTCKVVLTEAQQVKYFLSQHNNVLFNRPKIPNIIHLSKEYNTFSWKIENFTFDEEKVKEMVMILVSADSIPGVLLYEVTLFLNANFFSHSELIKMLTPCKLEFSAYEMIGDIIHLNLSDEQLEYKQLIADIIHFKTSKTVINKTGKIKDIYRFYECEVLAGPDNLKTVHNENNVKIFLDLGKVYWCSRLQAERSKILKMIQPGEIICDPFCGAGPHIIPAIKKGAKGVCNDLNPAALDCLKTSLEMNKIECDIIENLDAGVFLESHSDLKIDHFIFNLPEHSLEYIKYTEKYSGNFYLHVFFFCKSEDDVCEFFQKNTGYLTKPEWIREVRNVSPSKSVFKLEVKSEAFFNHQR